MKKKILAMGLSILMVGGIISGCSKEVKNVSSVDVNVSGKEGESMKLSEGLEVQEEVDVDLTALSSTMVYSEVYNMLSNPEPYIGKKIKMKGQFIPYQNQDKSNFYPAVLIADALACCAQGIEFELQGNPAYPEGYPELQSDITVVGTFDTYVEDGYRFCHLVDSVIV